MENLQQHIVPSMGIGCGIICQLPHLSHRFRFELNNGSTEVRISGDKLGIEVVDLLNRCDVERKGAHGESSFAAATFDARSTI